LTMDEVEKRFGAPVERHAAVGGASPQQPPITRWDYSGFAVVFERDRVVDAVATSGEPPSSPSSPSSPAVASTSGGLAALACLRAPSRVRPPRGSARTPIGPPHSRVARCRHVIQIW